MGRGTLYSNKQIYSHFLSSTFLKLFNIIITFSRLTNNTFKGNFCEICEIAIVFLTLQWLIGIWNFITKETTRRFKNYVQSTFLKFEWIIMHLESVNFQLQSFHIISSFDVTFVIVKFDQLLSNQIQVGDGCDRSNRFPFNSRDWPEWSDRFELVYRSKETVPRLVGWTILQRGRKLGAAATIVTHLLAHNLC